MRTWSYCYKIFVNSKICLCFATINNSKSINLLFKFLWNGTDKITRGAAINKYEHGGLKMLDLDSMIVILDEKGIQWLWRIT